MVYQAFIMLASVCSMFGYSVEKPENIPTNGQKQAAHKASPAPKKRFNLPKIMRRTRGQRSSVETTVPPTLVDVSAKQDRFTLKGAIKGFKKTINLDSVIKNRHPKTRRDSTDTSSFGNFSPNSSKGQPDSVISTPERVSPIAANQEEHCSHSQVYESLSDHASRLGFEVRTVDPPNEPKGPSLVHDVPYWNLGRLFSPSPASFNDQEWALKDPPAWYKPRSMVLPYPIGEDHMSCDGGDEKDDFDRMSEFEDKVTDYEREEEESEEVEYYEEDEPLDLEAQAMLSRLSANYVKVKKWNEKRERKITLFVRKFREGLRQMQEEEQRLREEGQKRIAEEEKRKEEEKEEEEEFDLEDMAIINEFCSSYLKAPEGREEAGSSA